MPRMSAELLARCSGQAKRKRDESAEQFLHRITHLYCSEKSIEAIEGLSTCRNLSVLYLYDNLIRLIEGVSSCPLTHLYLQNNHITTIQNLSTLHKLTKLYLSGNAITVVEGLEGLSSLTELHISHQRLAEGEKLLFDPRSLQAIAPTLTVLNVSGNGLDSIEELKCLREITHFSAMENQLGNMKSLSRVLSQWPRIWRVDLTGNPVSAKVKYRDRIITMGRCIGVVDAREVSETEREFLLSWKAMRRARRKHQRAGRILGGVNEGEGPLVRQVIGPRPPPLTLPALPARQPRLKADTRNKRGGEYLEPGLHMEVGMAEATELKLPDLIPSGCQTSPTQHKRKTQPGNSQLKYHKIGYGTHIGGDQTHKMNTGRRGGYGYTSREGYGDLSPLKEHSNSAWRTVAVADRLT